MFYTKQLASLLVLLALCAGCGKKNRMHQRDMRQEIDIPLTDDSFCSLFDDNLGEFSTELDVSEVIGNAELAELQDYTWVQDTQNEDGFMNIQFGYDSHALNSDQAKALKHNIELAKARLAEDSDYKPTLVIEGHACHAAGQPYYNMFISERRAERMCQALVQAGVPADAIRVVGRGDQMPMIIDGEMVTGDKVAQAPNRRCEMRVIYA